MAKLERTLIVDISLIQQAYKAGFEAAFMLMNDDSELESVCNCNNISTQIDQDNDDV